MMRKCATMFACLSCFYWPVSAIGSTTTANKTLVERCGIEEGKNTTGDLVILSRSPSRLTIMEKTIDRLVDVKLVMGYSYQQPRIQFKNKNKFGISALGIGVVDGDMPDCSLSPRDYKSTYLCKSTVPGVGVAAGETGVLDCDPRLRSDKWSGYCIIGFAPDFNSVGGGLAEAMNNLRLCN